MENVDNGLIRKNRRFFLNYNRLRRDFAFHVDRERGTVVFEIIPTLLALNEPELPGYIPVEACRCGIHGVGPARRLEEVVHAYFPESRDRKIPFQNYLLQKPLVVSLLLMGSIGTVAQTAKSDFDFWVCVDGAAAGANVWETLRRKTERISRWCYQQFGMEVHFFIMSLEQIRQNDFGSVDGESAGSSQKQFLKDECYRTMLLVCGKIPLWWVLPTGIDSAHYENARRFLIEENPLDSEDLVDLGFPGEISQAEFLGTALWHLAKGIKDPFKAVIKIAVMERYLSDPFQHALLCDLVKERIHGGQSTMEAVDPYLLMLEKVLGYYAEEQRRDHQELLKKAFYIKSDFRVTRMRWRTGGKDPKIDIFRALMKKWEWSLDLVEELNQIENWSYVRHLRFSNDIGRFFSSAYKNLSRILREHERQEIDDRDLMILWRKIYALFSRQENKINPTPYLTNKRLVIERCVFRFFEDRSGSGRWILYDASGYSFERQKKKSTIFSSDRLVRTAAWLVFNGLYDFEKTVVQMEPNPSGVIANDLTDLLKHIQGFFKSAMSEAVENSSLAVDAEDDRMMVVVDMEEEEGAIEPSTVDLILRNSWNEMFTYHYGFGEGLSVVRQLISGMQVSDVHELASRVRVHVPGSGDKNEVKRPIYHAIFQGL